VFLYYICIQYQKELHEKNTAITKLKNSSESKTCHHA